MENQSNPTLNTRTNTTRDGDAITAKIGGGTYTAEALAALSPDIWRNAGVLLGEQVEGALVTVVAMPTVEKVAEYGDKRWAWLHLAAGIKIKVYEGSERAKSLGLQFDGGKFRPAVIGNVAVVVTGPLKKLADCWTISTPWVVLPGARDEKQGEIADAVQVAFAAAHTLALSTVEQVFETVSDETERVETEGEVEVDDAGIHG